MNSKNYLYLISICIIILISGCKTVNDPDNFKNENGNVVYFNSFETESDTAGIESYGNCYLYNEASPGGGEQSLYVSGSSFIPHARFTIDSGNDFGIYQLSFWGKTIIDICYINFSSDGPALSNWTTISINDSSWHYYQTTDSIFCQGDEKLVITLTSGGDNPGGMLVDQIQIVKTK